MWLGSGGLRVRTQEGPWLKRHARASSGPVDQWTIGLLDQWTSGLLDQYTIGILDQWTSGLVDF